MLTISPFFRLVERVLAAAARPGARARRALALVLLAPWVACTAAPDLQDVAVDEAAEMTVALYQPGSHRVDTLHDRSPAKPHPAKAIQPQDASRIPSPTDNPWALGLMVGIVGWMAWIDHRQKRTKR